jgi:hypothetical protein
MSSTLKGLIAFVALALGTFLFGYAFSERIEPRWVGGFMLYSGIILQWSSVLFIFIRVMGRIIK